MTINGRNANGILVRKTVQPLVNEYFLKGCGSGEQQNYRECEHLHSDNDDSEENYFLEFSNFACLKVPHVGGKGASLARLERFAKKSNAEVRKITVFTLTFLPYHCSQT